MMSIGYLAHPDMKRFELNDSTLFSPPRPDAAAGSTWSAPQMPAFADFFGTYFHGKSFSVSEPKCSSMLENMKRCWENNKNGNPEDQCSYYINGFERLACAAN